MDLDDFEAKLVHVAAAELERRAHLLESRNPQDAAELLHLGEILGVFAGAGELVLEVRRLRALLEASERP